MRSILLIDDTQLALDDLVGRLKAFLNDEAEVRRWEPTTEEADPKAAFDARVDDETVLVVTDYDLTAHGRTGLFGSTVVGWCQERAIPVGDYSRANVGALPKEPNLFELRVPNDPDEAAKFIAAVFRGFDWIRRQLADSPGLAATKRSPAAVLAGLLGSAALESQFALYSVRLGTTNAALFERIVRTTPSDVEPTDEEKRVLLGYIIGHLLLNAILRFPGPILSCQALTAYVGASENEANALAELFANAKYTGPFSELGPFFWLPKVDEVLQPMIQGLPRDLESETDGEETHGEVHREAVERRLVRQLARHACSRCDGRNGGFWCPFMRRAVCQRSDCSVGSNSWIPQGARICRIERDFYDEWAPILGI